MSKSDPTSKPDDGQLGLPFGRIMFERICPDCHATESEITSRGHRQLDGLGRPVVPDTMTSTYCPQACSCGAECFNMAEHDARELPQQGTV